MRDIPNLSRGVKPMSIIASCSLLSRASLEKIRAQMREGRSGQNLLFALNFERAPLPDFPGDGFHCGMALLWLNERRKVNLMRSEYDDVMKQLFAGRNCMLLTADHRERYQSQIVPEDFSTDDLESYTGAGEDSLEFREMREALRWLKECLGQVGEDQVAMVSIA